MRFSSSYTSRYYRCFFEFSIYNRYGKKKHNKIIVLAKNKLNTIDTLLSSALNDSEISHEKFSNIITEANIYENIKENIKELTTEPTELSSIAELTTGSNTKEKLTTL